MTTNTTDRLRPQTIMARGTALTIEFEFPSFLKKYTKRLITEYKNNEMNYLVPLLEQSECRIKTGTTYDNWAGGIHGHEVVFLVPDELMGLIPLDGQNEIQSRITQDLNKASSAIPSEVIEQVHFEYKDDEPISQRVDEVAVKRIWQPNNVKLFVSHRDHDKTHVHNLARHLEKYGISSFIAHISIEPDEQWQSEFEKALMSMDAMLAFITDDFFKSAWTNQEVGYAIAKGIPVISLKIGKTDPQGFIQSRQALKGSLQHLDKSAAPIFKTVKKRLAHSPEWKNVVIERFCHAENYASAIQTSRELYDLKDLSNEDIDKIVSCFNRNRQLNTCKVIQREGTLLKFLNRFSSENLAFSGNKIIKENLVSDIPF
jgi:hypothetical protein